MSDQPSLEEAGIRLVAIVEKTMWDISAYNAKCLTCGWVCHKQPHDRQSTAVKHAEKHVCGDTKGAL
jgi:hypothetical protein